MNKDNNMLQLSIIVPIYNVEDYLLECLDSLDSATHNIEAEILLIDDGSKDGSSDIAKEYAKNHTKFRYFHKENGGLADTRNYGIRNATGKYLAFIDSDDIVTEDMFEKMIASAEMHDTDITITNVTRFDSKSVFDASLYARMFNDVDELVTHINKCDRLIFDTIVCNKIVRRDFWNENGFEFPVGFRFEDMAVALAMHCRARRVSIVKTVGYLWRVREGESRSITQENTKTVNLKHRLIMLDRMYDFIDSEMGGDQRLKKLLDYKILSLDLIIYLNAMADQKKSEQEEFRTVITKFFDRHFEMDELDSLPAISRQKYIDVLERRYSELFPLRRYGKRSYNTAPVIRTKDGDKLKLETDLFDQVYYDAKNEFLELPPLHAIDDIEYSDGKMFLVMHSFFNRVDVFPGDQSVSAAIQNVVSGKREDLPVKMVGGNQITSLYGRVFDELTGEIHDHNYDGAAYCIEIDPTSIGRNKDLFGDNIITVKYTNPIKSGTFFIRNADSHVSIEERLDGYVLTGNDTSIEFGHDAQKTLVLNIGKTGSHKGDEKEEVPKDQAWLVDLKKDGEGLTAIIGVGKSAEITEKRPVLLCYEDKLAGNNVKLAESRVYWEGSNTYISFVIDSDMPEVLPNLYEMQSNIILQQREGAVTPVYASREQRASISADPLKLTFLSNKEGKLSLLVNNLGRLSMNNIHYNKRIIYPGYRDEKINDKMILFESYWGTQYSCNPRALYEYIDANHPEYTCVWSLVDDRIPIKGNGRRVTRGSQEYYHCLATAKYLVNNVNFEKAYVKRQGQIEIQTMHGTPLKTVGLDAKNEFRSDAERVEYVKKSRHWNYLIAQGKFTEQNASNWYGFNKKILCTGYPRTDELFNVSKEEIRTIKDKFELPDNKKIILYAPTFRKIGAFEMPMDIDRLKDDFSDEYILLIRLHHFSSNAYKVPEDGEFVFDAGKYDSITDLYKISDILITDYSSVMFDFALTGKPMVFYTYDLDEYVSQTRGVYFDITTEGPGPIVRTNEELLNVLKEGGKGNEDRVKQFMDKYLTYECANSSELIYNEVFTNQQRGRETLRQSILRIIKAVIPKKYYKKLREKKIKKDII